MLMQKFGGVNKVYYGNDENSKLINGKDFSKISKPTERDGVYHLKFSFLLLFSVDERLELGNRENGKKIFDVPFRTVKED